MRRIRWLVVLVLLSGCAVDRERYVNSTEYKAGYRAGVQDAAALHVGFAAAQLIQR